MAVSLKEDLAGVRDMPVMHDSWTSLNTENYSCVTGHFINQEWELRNVVLETTKHTGLHTSEAIAAGMQKCKDTWIPQVDTPAAVTDNAANEKKGF